MPSRSSSNSTAAQQQQPVMVGEVSRQRPPPTGRGAPTRDGINVQGPEGTGKKWRWPTIETKHDERDQENLAFAPLSVADLLMSYSKRPDLLFDLARAVKRLYGGVVGELGEARSVRCEHAARVWRVRDRLSAADIDSLIARYREGVTTWELAEHFKIGMTSVKQLLREHGVRRDGFTRSSRQSGSPRVEPDDLPEVST